MVYKAFNAEAPVYLTEPFHGVSDIASRSLRRPYLNLRPPRFKYHTGKIALPTGKLPFGPLCLDK